MSVITERDIPQHLVYELVHVAARNLLDVLGQDGGAPSNNPAQNHLRDVEKISLYLYSKCSLFVRLGRCFVEH